MRDYGTFDGHLRINIKIARNAIQPLRGGLQDVLHDSTANPYFNMVGAAAFNNSSIFDFKLSFVAEVVRLLKNLPFNQYP